MSFVVKLGVLDSELLVILFIIYTLSVGINLLIYSAVKLGNSDSEELITLFISIPSVGIISLL